MFYCPWLLAISRPWARFRIMVQLIIGPVWFYDYAKISAFYWQESARYASQPGMHISLYECWVQALHALDLTASLVKIHCPTLIVFGKNDLVIPSSDRELSHQNIANSQMVLFDECGHFPFADQPTQFFSAVKAFLA
jgi:pimeloyl-ACP methyl ester carboxylesterase